MTFGGSLAFTLMSVVGTVTMIILDILQPTPALAGIAAVGGMTTGIWLSNLLDCRR